MENKENIVNNQSENGETDEKDTLDTKKDTLDTKKDTLDTKKEEKKYSDKDVDEIVKKKYAKWVESSNAKMDDAKKTAYEDGSNSKMSELETLKEQLEQIKTENKELKGFKQTTELNRYAVKYLKDEYNISMSESEISTLIVGTDEDSTKSKCDALYALLNKTNTVLTGKTPKKADNSTDISYIQQKINKYKK